MVKRFGEKIWLGQLSHFNQPSCTICNGFEKPTFKSQSRERSPIAAPMQYEDILRGCNQKCPGCCLLKDIIAYYHPVGDKRRLWVSLVPPSVFSSQYQILINSVGSFEIFTIHSTLESFMSSCSRSKVDSRAGDLAVDTGSFTYIWKYSIGRVFRPSTQMAWILCEKSY